MSGPNTVWRRSRKFFVCGLILALVIVLAMNTLLMAGPVGDPEPTDPNDPQGEPDPPPGPEGDEGDGTPSCVMFESD